jgi:serine phosphatase RsbU (regulator of sigma subunit)/TPR repeat protein
MKLNFGFSRSRCAKLLAFIPALVTILLLSNYATAKSNYPLFLSKIKAAEQHKSKPDSALYYLKQAQVLAQADSSLRKVAELSYKIGKAFYLTSNFRQAVPFLEKSAAINFQIKDTSNYGWTLHFQALNLKYWGHYRDALQKVQLANKVFTSINESSGIAHAQMVEVYIYEAWGQVDKIEATCREALGRFEELKNESGEAYCLLAFGNFHLANNSNDSAKVYYDKALALFTKIDDTYGKALTRRDLARYSTAINNPGSALANMNISLTLLNECQNRRGISEVEMLLGDYYLKQGKYSQAIYHLEKGQQIAISIELAEDMVKNYKLLSIAYEKMGNKEKALKCFQAFSTLKDSIFNAEKHLQLADLQTKYATEKKEQQIAIQKIQLEKSEAEVSRQRLFIGFLTIGLLLFGALSFVIYRLYKIKRRDNELLAKQKREIENKNKQITDSINYAKRIQNAVLPAHSEITKHFPESFVLFKPKDIVSGDFFYFTEVDGTIVVAAADCTGHGVPGAFMSMLGSALIKEILISEKIDKPSTTLERMRVKAKEALHQSSYQSDAKDGMEMALCFYNAATRELQYAGAGNPLYQIRDGELIETKATRCPIGIHIKEFPFENHLVETQPGDNIYLFSDGFADQMGGLKGDKVKIKEFKNQLIQCSHLPLEKQREMLDNFLTTWMTGYDQTDDILVIGFRIP